MPHSTHTSTLDTILASTRDNMQKLLLLLKNETVVLEESNLEAMKNITLEKIALTEQIEKNEQERIHFLVEKKLDPNEPRQWLKSNNLLSVWNDIKNLSEQSQKQNQINGLVINGNRRRIQTQIEIISSSSPAVELVYSASGESVNQRNSNTLAHV